MKMREPQSGYINFNHRDPREHRVCFKLLV